MEARKLRPHFALIGRREVNTPLLVRFTGAPLPPYPRAPTAIGRSGQGVWRFWATPPLRWVWQETPPPTDVGDSCQYHLRSGDAQIIALNAQPSTLIGRNQGTPRFHIVCRLSHHSGAPLPPYPRALRVPLRPARPVLALTGCGMRAAGLSREVCLLASVLGEFRACSGAP